jgi:hypothetical protein
MYLRGGLIRRDPEIAALPETIREFAEHYRSENPEWFGRFRGGGKPTEYYHPDLVLLIRNEFGKKNARNVPEGWFTAAKLAFFDGITAKAATIKKFVETYRESNLSWFQKYWTEGGFTEHYAPELVSLVKEEFSSSVRKLAPEGWRTPGQLGDYGKPNKIKRFALGYRNEHPEWFKGYLNGTRFEEHYHPELVQLVATNLRKRKSPRK